MGERSPSYFEWMMYVHRALEDPSYEAGPEDRAIAEDVRTAMQTGGQAHETGDVIAQSMARKFEVQSLERLMQLSAIVKLWK